MKISDILKKKKMLSCEVFPPKEADGVPKLQKEPDQLFQLSLDFISCTYGAMGTNVGESKAICKYIVDRKVNGVTRFTVIGKTAVQLKEIFATGVDDGLAMRGDFQKDPAAGEFPWITVPRPFLRQTGLPYL